MGEADKAEGEVGKVEEGWEGEGERDRRFHCQLNFDALALDSTCNTYTKRRCSRFSHTPSNCQYHSRNPCACHSRSSYWMRKKRTVQSSLLESGVLG